MNAVDLFAVQSRISIDDYLTEEAFLASAARARAYSRRGPVGASSATASQLGEARSMGDQAIGIPAVA